MGITENKSSYGFCGDFKAVAVAGNSVLILAINRIIGAQCNEAEDSIACNCYV